MEKRLKAYGVLDIKKERLLPDFMGRLCYTTKAKATSVAKQWGVLNNVVKVEIVWKH